MDHSNIIHTLNIKFDSFASELSRIEIMFYTTLQASDIVPTMQRPWEGRRHIIRPRDFIIRSSVRKIFKCVVVYKFNIGCWASSSS